MRWNSKSVAKVFKKYQGSIQKVLQRQNVFLAEFPKRVDMDFDDVLRKICDLLRIGDTAKPKYLTVSQTLVQGLDSWCQRFGQLVQRS